MEDEKKYLSYKNLKYYNNLLKEKITKDTTASIESAKSYADGLINNIKSGNIVVKESEHSATSDSATTANSATSATKAVQDGNGKVISSTYETKTDAQSKLDEAKSYTDELGMGFTSVLINMFGDDYNEESGAVPTIREISNDEAEDALVSAKSYTDTKISNLINGAPTTLDTLGEIATAMAENEDVVEALENAVGTKANASDLTAHTGNKSNPHGVTKSQVGLGSVENKSSATIRGEITKSNVTTALGYTPYTPTEVDTLVNTHKSDSTAHMTSTQKSQLTTAYNHSQSAHAPSNAEPNQNAFSNIAISGQTTVSADTSTDTITFEGYNVSITTDATNDKVTFSVADGTTSEKGLVQLTDSTSSTSKTTAATPASVKAAYDKANHSHPYLTTSNPTGTGSLSMNRKSDTTVGSYSTTLGLYCIASGVYSCAEGAGTEAKGMCSHAEGSYTIASSNDQHVQGKFNVEDITYAHILGNGKSSTSRSNAHTIDWQGNAWFSGDVYVGGTSQRDATALVKQTDFDSHRHSASHITSGTLSSDRLPTVPITKGGTGATTASGALSNLGITATATEINYIDGVTSNIQTQLNNKASSSHTHDRITSGIGSFAAMYFDDSTKKNHWFKPDVNYPTTQEISIGSNVTRTWDNIYVNNGLYLSDGSCVEKNDGDLAITSSQNGDVIIASLNNRISLVNGSGTLNWRPYSTDNYECIFNTTQDCIATCGSSSYRWYRLYAASATVLTSDEREKSDIMSISDYPMTYSRNGEGNVFEQLYDKLNPKTYTLNVEKTNDVHIGFVAQDIEKSLEELGLTVDDLGLINHEYWVDENGEEKDRYGLAYEEFIALNTYMIQKQKTKIKEQQELIESLEERVVRLETLLNNN